MQGIFKVLLAICMYLAGGGNAEYVAVHEDHVMAVPAGLTLLDAAAIPEVWLTAYQLLHVVGKDHEMLLVTYVNKREAWW